MRYDIGKLKRKQLEQGMTDIVLAQKSGVPRRTINDMFNRGSAHPDTVSSVARALKVKLGDLIVDEPVAGGGRGVARKRA